MKTFVALDTPHGYAYIDPDAVVSIGHADTHWCYDTVRAVRAVTTSGGSVYYMFDDAVNMQKLLCRQDMSR